MDPANVALTIFRMPSSLFAEYNVKEDAVLAIHLKNLKQIPKKTFPTRWIPVPMQNVAAK